MQQTTLYFTDFERLVLLDALRREWRLLDIVTAKEREAGNQDGWALARIKVRAVRSALSQVVQELPWTAGEGYHLLPEDEADLAERVAAIGQKMRPPRAELERQMSVKARRRSAAQKAKPPSSLAATTSTAAGFSGSVGDETVKPRWTAPKYE